MLILPCQIIPDRLNNQFMIVFPIGCSDHALP